MQKLSSKAEKIDLSGFQAQAREQEQPASMGYEAGAEEWLAGTLALARTAAGADLCFFFLHDHQQDSMTAYLALDGREEVHCRKIQWPAELENKDLFSDSSAVRKKELTRILAEIINKDYLHVIGQPLQLTGDYRGLVGVASCEQKTMPPDTGLLLDLIGSNILRILKNRGMQGSFRKLRKEMDALMRFSKYLSSNTDDLEIVLEKILEELKSIFEVESCGVLLYDPDRKVLVLQKPAFGIKNEQFTSYALSTDPETENGIGVAVKVFLSGKPYICNMTDRDHVTNQQLARMYGARSSLSVPLVVDNRRIGVIHTINKKDGIFTGDDARLLELLAYQLAIVIENARLFKQLEKKNELLRHSMDVHNKLTRLVLRNKSFDEIIYNLARLIKRDIIVQDQFFKILGAHQAEAAEDLKILEQSMSGELWNDQHFRELMHRVNNYKQAVLFKAFPEGGLSRSRVIAPITLANNILGYVSILAGENHELGEMEFLAIEHAVTVFTLKMMQSKIAYEVEERISGDFLDDLLNGSYHSAQDMIQRASYLGYDLLEPYRVICIDVDLSSGQLKKQKGNEGFLSQVKRRVFDLAKNCVEEKIPFSMAGIKSDATVIIAPEPRDSSFPELAETALQVKERIRQMIPDITVSIGIGRVCAGIEDIKHSYREARRAIFIARKFGKIDQVIDYESLGAYKILFSIRDDQDLKQFVDQVLGPVIEYDRGKNNSVLIDTLNRYLNANCNNQKTADSLFIHLNTLKYRLQKIQNVAGVDLNDPEIRLNLQLALKVLEIKDLQ